MCRLVYKVTDPWIWGQNRGRRDHLWGKSSWQPLITSDYYRLAVTNSPNHAQTLHMSSVHQALPSKGSLVWINTFHVWIWWRLITHFHTWPYTHVKTLHLFVLCMCEWSRVKVRACLASLFPSFITHHSSLITHNSSLITYHSIFHTRLASSPNFHNSIFFTLFVGPYLSAGTVFFLKFFFSTQTHRSK